MAYDVIISAEAEQDVDEIIWYEEQQTGLGIRFYSLLLERFKELKYHPEYYSFIYDKYRRLTVDPFPYKIIYKIYGQTVLVLALLHHRRNPAEFF